MLTRDGIYTLDSIYVNLSRKENMSVPSWAAELGVGKTYLDKLMIYYESGAGKEGTSFQEYVEDVLAQEEKPSVFARLFSRREPPEQMPSLDDKGGLTKASVALAQQLRPGHRSWQFR